MVPRPSRAAVVRALAVAFVAVFTFTLIEGGARLFFLLRERRTAVDPRTLDAYEVVDGDDPSLWRLRPGFSQTLAEAAESKRASGHLLGYEVLRESGARLGIPPREVIYTINRRGFKGPEVAQVPSGIRILNIGDSCTFGTLIDRYSYPRSLERELRRSEERVEVVNGGVEGYAPAQVLARMEDFRALRPDVATVYVGWNALWAEPVSYGPERYLRVARLLRRARERLQTLRNPRGAAMEAFTRPKRPDADAPEVREMEEYVPTFMGDVERIVDEMETDGVRVVIATLPGLYVMEEAPSLRALKIGHLPAFTDNPYVLAKLTERYNGALREMARRRGLPLVDLDRWSREALRPRDSYFIDSVHLTEEGQTLLGKHMAERLRPLLEDVTEGRGRGR